jgi:4-carboxymuconolactone decarboxylase
LSSPVYEQARAAFGTEGIADLLFLIGAYQAVCGVLNAFEVPAPR